MKRFLIISLMAFVLAVAAVVPAMGQKITDAGYKTVAYIKSDGTVQDSGYKTGGALFLFQILNFCARTFC